MRTYIKASLIMALLLLSSCIVDYDLDASSIKEPDRIIINCYLNPNNPVSIKIGKSQNTGNKLSISYLTNYHIIFKENQNILFEGICNDSVIKMEYFPKIKYNYSIEVSHEQFKTVKATTHVPETIKCSVELSTIDDAWYGSQYLVSVNCYELSLINKECMWITSYQINEDNDIRQYNELYTKNPLVDLSNSVSGSEVKNPIVGSIYHNGFLRFRNRNIQSVSEIVFTPNFVFSEGNYSPEVPFIQTGLQVRIITGSPEYDLYNKSLYDQKYMIVYDEDISTIFYQPVSVYNNIENGLGIFAGVNELISNFDLPQDK